MLLRVGNRLDLPELTVPPSSLPRSSSRRSTNAPVRNAVAADPEMSDADRLLFEELRAWRREAAHEKGVSPFIVMYDRVLREIVTHRPASKRDLERID